jgi:GMP synthase-like glutamine amidotransferase
MTSLHIAILDTDTPVPNVVNSCGLYSDIFEALLRGVAPKVPSMNGVTMEFSSFDCVKGELPSLAHLKSIDGMIITGSCRFRFHIMHGGGRRDIRAISNGFPAASAYDNEVWISQLSAFLQGTSFLVCWSYFLLSSLCTEIYAKHRQIRIFGSCFGHQLLAQALFSHPPSDCLSPCVVEKDPKGWELGVQPIALSAPFLARFGPVTSNPADTSSLRLQFVHADHVIPECLPVVSPQPAGGPGFVSIGSSEHCRLQGFWQDGRVLTYQGHAEFDRFMNAETVKVFGAPIWEDSFMTDALVAIEANDDAEWAAGVMLRFFVEERATAKDWLEEETFARL